MRKIETGEGQKNVNLIYIYRNILFDPRIHIQYVGEIRSQRNNQIKFLEGKKNNMSYIAEPIDYHYEYLDR